MPTKGAGPVPEAAPTTGPTGLKATELEMLGGTTICTPTMPVAQAGTTTAALSSLVTAGAATHPGLPKSTTDAPVRYTPWMVMWEPGPPVEGFSRTMSGGAPAG